MVLRTASAGRAVVRSGTSSRVQPLAVRAPVSLQIRLDGRPASSHSLPLREDPRILQEFAIELDPEPAGDADGIQIEIEGEYISLAYWFYARDAEARRDREP